MAEQIYNLANIRDFLTKGFSDEELRILCFDMPGFRPVYEQLGSSTSKTEIISRMIEFADRTMQMDTLLVYAQERNSHRYREHEPYYLSDPLPALQRQVASLARRLSVLTSPTNLTREQQFQIALHWTELGSCHSLAHFDLAEANLRVANLAGADLRAAALMEANLGFADLRGADLREADLYAAILNDARLEGADLRNANLTAVKAEDIDLRQADLSKACIFGAGFAGANLQDAKLLKADFRNTILRRAKLTDADLTNADLTNAEVSQEQLDSAKSLEGATMPDGSTHE